MSNEMTPTFQGEVMLAGWKDSHTSGATVTFWLPEASELEVFRGLTVRKGGTAGQRFMAVLVEIQDDETTGGAYHNGGETCRAAIKKDATKTDGDTAPSLASSMHRNGYFRNPKLWAAMDEHRIYTQVEHKAWIETLPCWAPANALSYSHARVWNCAGVCCAHHTPSAALPAAGKATDNPRKPPHWYTLPMCHPHHEHWAHGSGPHGATREDKQHMVEAAIALTADRIKNAMKVYIGIESMREITPEMLHNFEIEIDARRHDRNA